MPSLEDIKNNNFKKKNYRVWNLSGQDSSSITKNTDEPSLPYSDIIHNSSETILEISCDNIKNWEFHDRPENELGDIESLANEFKEIGQQQPCIVRLLNKDLNLYELIVGERRWRAAQLAKVKLKVIVKDLSDSEAAIIQASENHNRKDLSDYARGISYFHLIEKGIITQKELSEKLNISKQQISRLLSFSKIPHKITSKIQDFSKISARTAEEIKQLSNKGDDYIEAILSLCDRLQTGEIGREKLQLLVEKTVNKNMKFAINNHKVYSKNGRHLFTWRQDNNNCPSIHFPKDMASLIDKKNLDPDFITTKFVEFLEDYLMNVIIESPAGD